MTTFLLVRHAAHDWLGRGIAGRLPGVSLNAEGQAQAQALVARLASWPLQAIVCSPQQRTRETAAAVAAARGLPMLADAGFDEIDFGDWTGTSFDDLRAHPHWPQWVDRRSTAQPPGGEPFADVPARAMAVLHRLCGEHPDGHVLVVSHGDVLKAVVATALGLSLDHLERFDLAPASLSVLAMGPGWQRLEQLNAR